MTPKAFVIAGPSSGVGKTTMTLGLMAALNRRGLTVQPFKCGPDFIDPGHHRRVCQRASHNLDGWMLSAEVNRAIFLQHSASADVSVVEGVMGLFDGAGGSSSTGSTAAIAVFLNLPIVLVVDASHMAASAAALVHGFATFDSTVHLAGVIFNRVGSATHYGLLKDAVERAGSVPSLGYLPHDERLRIPERYLGLVTAGEEILSEQAIACLVDLVEQHPHRRVHGGDPSRVPAALHARGHGRCGGVRRGSRLGQLHSPALSVDTHVGVGVRRSRRAPPSARSAR
jgi:cobyrinic acid a,c-diamide synthase